MQRDRTQALSRAITRGGAAAGSGVAVRNVISRVAPNPATTVRGLADSLHLNLTAQQLASVDSIGVWLEAKDSALVDEAQLQLDSAGGDIRQAFPQIQPALQLARNNYVAAVKSMQAVLTAAQWELLPEWFRNPTTNANGGARGGPGGAGRVARPPGGVE